uniref:Uncharacterized protein n=1 Tax=Cacopsylla melanoneura TaxID=428564 RepID=A0A8D8SKX1_9HEMI
MMPSNFWHRPFTMPYPMPLLAPVTTATFSMTPQVNVFQSKRILLLEFFSSAHTWICSGRFTQHKHKQQDVGSTFFVQMFNKLLFFFFVQLQRGHRRSTARLAL